MGIDFDQFLLGFHGWLLFHLLPGIFVEAAI
jgi:hypothetical protein